MAKKKAARTQTAVYNAKVPAAVVENKKNSEATHPETTLNAWEDKLENKSSLSSLLLLPENERGIDPIKNIRGSHIPAPLVGTCRSC